MTDKELVKIFLPKGTKTNPITLAQIAEIGRKTKIQLITKTVPSMRLTNNPFAHKVFKYSFIEGWINFNYEKEVNKQRKIEGLRANFESLPRQWGDHLSQTPFVCYKPKSSPLYKLYLKVMITDVLQVEYRTDENQSVSPAELAPFFFAKNESVRQGTFEPIVERDYYVENIRMIKLNKQFYNLV